MDVDSSYLKLYPLQTLAPNSHAHAKRCSAERAWDVKFDCDEQQRNLTIPSERVDGCGQKSVGSFSGFTRSLGF